MSEKDAEKARQQFEEKIVERARKDDVFRQALLADPKGTITREYGAKLPASISLDHVVVADPGAIAHAAGAGHEPHAKAAGGGGPNISSTCTRSWCWCISLYACNTKRDY